MEFAFAFVVFTSPFGGQQETPRNDHWFGRDKAKHFAVSFVVQGVTHSVLRANGFAYRDAAWTAGATTISVGISKEVWDRSQGRFFSWRDLAADAAGGGSAAILMNQLRR